MKKVFSKMIFFALLTIVFLLPVNEVQGASNKVFYAKINSEVTKGLHEYLQRAIKTAETEGAETIIFEVNTPGGAVDAAADIANLLNNTSLKTVAYINPDAISAGAFISLNMDEIYMSPTGRMGAAAVITQDGNAADKKAQSYWRAAMKNAAENRNRDPIYALAMVDESIDLPEYDAPKGELLTLTANQALEVGYTDAIVANKVELLKQLGYSNADVVEFEKTFAERLAELITHPFVIPILLTIASLGLILELYSPGFGVPGFMGITALLLFFYGHYIAGLAGYESILLFILGIILIIVEFFIPGGIVGFIGLGSILLSIMLAGGNIVQMGINLLVAFTVAIVAMVILVKKFGKKLTMFNKIVLRDRTSTEEGYVSHENRTDLLNKIGIAATPLRPAGTIMIDNERVDAVSEGGFIKDGAEVIVIQVEGVRVVVREVTKEDKE